MGHLVRLRDSKAFRRLVSHRARTSNRQGLAGKAVSDCHNRCELDGPGCSWNDGHAELCLVRKNMARTGLFQVIVLAGASIVVGCATASPAMDMGDGTYLISARAAPARGGATGAMTVAHEDERKFCAQQGDGLRPIVVGAQDRDIYQSSIGGGFSGTPTGGYSGGFGGSTMAAGSVNMRFRCGGRVEWHTHGPAWRPGCA